MNVYCASLNKYERLPTREVKIGALTLGAGHPIRIQTMTTTNTMDTAATVAQCIRCIEAGAELVRITAPSKNEAENLLNIKNELRARGYDTPLIADIHFTPNAAEIAARIVEKVRVNPGNYADKKRFDFIEYNDAEYAAEVQRIRERFTPLVRICREYGTAMRIGANHGSLSDRIMSRYGDSPIGMVESAMEFLRIARDEDYHQIILSMKSSNPQVMVQAYRLLVQKMYEEFGELYPLHLGVTEAGDGEDGRIKSAIGIGSLLEDGIGDTIRVSLTEDPEFEIPVCKDIVSRYAARAQSAGPAAADTMVKLPYSPFSYKRRNTRAVGNTGGHQVPVVAANFAGYGAHIAPADLTAIGYTYNADTDKWNISDGAADYIYTGGNVVGFELPGTLQVLCDHAAWLNAPDHKKYHPVLTDEAYIADETTAGVVHFVTYTVPAGGDDDNAALLNKLAADKNAVLMLTGEGDDAMRLIRNFMTMLIDRGIECPAILQVYAPGTTIDKQLIDFAVVAGGLLLDGFGDGLMLLSSPIDIARQNNVGRTIMKVDNHERFVNNTAFSILQASRTRISKTEYISCPSCGRTLFDLQETTAKIRASTNHLKGVKIAIMGCIVNGPGEMADADFGYVGSGAGKITLYRGKEVVKKNIPSEIAVAELISLIKDEGAWVDAE